MKAIELFFIGLSAAVVAIPGMKLLGTDAWWPPDADAFRVAASVVGAAALLLVLLARRQIIRARRGVVAAACAVGLTVALVLVFWYFVSLRRAVLDYTYRGTDFQTLVPFRVGSWATPQHLALATSVEDPDGDPPRSEGDLTVADLKRAFEHYGPDGMEPYMTDVPRTSTLAVLFFLYCTCISLVAASFTAMGVRLANWSGVDEKAPPEEEEVRPARSLEG